MKIEIKKRFSREIIISGEYESVKDCLEKNRGKNLTEVNLTGADLTGADLHGVDLTGADLTGADLTRVDLTRVDLTRADLYGEKITKTPLQILGLRWWVLILERQIKIGCEIHDAKDWEKFEDSRIEEMDSDALEWWRIHKVMIMEMWRAHVKKPKGV